MPTKSPLGTVTMNILLSVIVGLCSWTLTATHKNSIAIADLTRMVADGKEQRLVFTVETKQFFKECAEKLNELDGRVSTLETKAAWKP